MANYVLEILDGDRAGEVLPVGDATLRIGRKAGNDIVLADEKTSGVHCEISPEGDRLVLKDLGSTNGTFLDGKRITEVVLTPGDIVTVGRVKVCFRAEGDEPVADADAGEFAVRHLDAGRLQKRGGSLGLIAVLVLVLGGGGGFYFWQSQQQQRGGGENVVAKQRDPLVVDGNRLDAALAGCEVAEGWNLRAGGIGFRENGPAHTGSSGFAAFVSTDEAGEGKAATERADFAIMELAAPIKVFAGRTFTCRVHAETVGAAEVALRAKVFAEDEQFPFHFCHGTRLTGRDGWEVLEVVATVPASCDRLSIEVVALVPDGDSEARVDDFAIVEGGESNGVDVLQKDDGDQGSGQRAFGFGSSVAVRSTDADNAGTLLAIRPGNVPAKMARLHAAGLSCLSDIGASLTCEKGERALVLQAQGTDALQFVFPAEAPSGLLIAGADDAFESAAAESSFTSSQVLLGSFSTRALLRFEQPVELQGSIGGGLYRLAAKAGEVTMVLDFGDERRQAGKLVREARAAREQGQPGKALDTLARLMQTVPMDSEELASAQELRREVLAAQADEAARLRKDLEEAGFFDTRGGFERVVSGVDRLVGLYGEHNVEDLKSLRELRTQAGERLEAIDQGQVEQQKERLELLANAFGTASQTGLQKLVQDYINKHLK